MKLRHAFSIYPKAIAWSVILSSAIIMEGYDTAVLGSYYAFPPFLRKFGVPTPDGGLTIPPSWQNGLSAATNVGEVIGLQIAGFMSERVGYRWTLIGALAAITGFIFVLFFSESLGVLVAAELLCGIPWGVFQTMTVAYAAEVCPVPLRHYLTAYVNLCWIIGQFISAGIIKGLVHNTTKWGYKIPWAVQWVWPIPIAMGTYFAPESPWWCVRNGQLGRARHSLRRLARSVGFDGRDEDRSIALMIYTNEMEKQVAAGTRYWDCFRGVDRRRTEIVCMTWIAQTLSGTVVGGLSSFFYTNAGISTNNAYSLALGQTGIGAAGTIASWFIMNKVGRKKLMCWGMVVMFCLLMYVHAASSAVSTGLLMRYTGSPEEWVSHRSLRPRSPGPPAPWCSCCRPHPTSASAQWCTRSSAKCRPPDSGPRPSCWRATPTTLSTSLSSISSPIASSTRMRGIGAPRLVSSGPGST